jgi:hypothetical protein
MPGMPFSPRGAAVFTLQAMLLVIARAVHSDLVIGPREDVAPGLKAAFIAHALIAHPLIGPASSQAFHALPVLGCRHATVILSSGLPRGRQEYPPRKRAETGLPSCPFYPLSLPNRVAQNLLLWASGMELVRPGLPPTCI